MIMNALRLGPIALALLLVATSTLSAVRAGENNSTPVEPERLLRHVVLFQFKENAAPEDIRKVEEAFRALPAAISEIHDFEWGTNVSIESLDDGFTHCFLVTFRSEADRDAYLPHPAHEEFVAIAGPRLARALVVDYWAAP